MNTSKITLNYALILGFIALLCTAVSTGVYLLTKGKIDDVTAMQQRKLLEEVVPKSHFDNDVLATCKLVQLENAPYLNRIYVAKKIGKSDRLPSSRNGSGRLFRRYCAIDGD